MTQNIAQSYRTEISLLKAQRKIQVERNTKHSLLDKSFLMLAIGDEKV